MLHAKSWSPATKKSLWDNYSEWYSLSVCVGLKVHRICPVLSLFMLIMIKFGLTGNETCHHRY